MNWFVSRVFPIRVLCVVFGLLLLGGFLPGADVAVAGPTDTSRTLDRLLEPVTVTKIYEGVPISELCVYRRTGGNFEVIPFQIDEKDGDGKYISNEDGIFDSNDEIVFLAGDTGDKSDVLIANVLPVGFEWYQIEVTNPISPTAKGWAYVVRSTQVDCTNATDYASFDAGAMRLNAKDYAIGWASSHNGLDFTSLFGGPDILDRSKLRINFRFLGPQERTEDDIAVQDLNLIKDGKVRVIVNRAGAETLGYASYTFTRTPVDLSVIPGTLEMIRISTDLAPATVGTYFDENTANGAPIDGVGDSVPASPANQTWRQVSLNAGTIVQFGDFSSVGGTLQHFYQDQLACGNDDTGDKQCWGDSGFSVLNPPKQPIDVSSGQFVLPGSQPNVGATYYNYSQNPLTVSATKQNNLVVDIYLPRLER